MLCPHCGATENFRGISAWTLVVDERARAELGVDGRILRRFTLAAAGGSGIPLRSECVIVFAMDWVRIDAPPDIHEFVYYGDIHALQVSGSTRTTNAGVIGGGFGVAGAVEGMLAASVINSLTTSTTIYTLLRIATKSAEYVFISRTFESSNLQMFLTSIQPRVRQGQAASALQALPPHRASAESVADELLKLSKLRDSGVISDAEFASMKARLLGGY